MGQYRSIMLIKGLLLLFVVSSIQAIADLDIADYDNQNTDFDYKMKHEWEAFKAKYGKTYDSFEDKLRRNVYAENSRFTKEHNDLYEKGVESYSVAMNEFGDMSDEEAMHKLHGQYIDYDNNQTTDFDYKMKHEWEAFKAKYGKTYDSFEDKLRRNVFVENSRFIKEHNDLYEKGVESYSVAMNEFGDMSDEEAMHKLHGQYIDDDDEDLDDEEAATFMPPPSPVIPRTFNWRKRGAVTRVKNQRNCMSCWAFAATAAVESHNFIKTRRLVALSEQNLIDCSGKDGYPGCNGGNAKKAYNYITKNKGIDTERSYPYRARKGNCRYRARYAGATTKGYMKVPRSEYALQVAVATRGPVAVSANVNGLRGFRFFKRGVFYEKHCPSKSTKRSIKYHAMLVVGYGTVLQGQYWLVKNSWGRKWGLKGYIRMARNRNNNCGIASRATFPLV